MTENLYIKHMHGLKQLEAEARIGNPMLALVATMANQELEQRLRDGKATETDIGMLERAAARAGRPVA